MRAFKGGNHQDSLASKIMGNEEFQNKVQEKMAKAMGDLALKAQRQEEERARQRKMKEEAKLRELEDAPRIARINEISALGKGQEKKDDDLLEDDEEELEKWRKKRLNELKEQDKENQTGPGAGEYTEIAEDEFLKSVIASKFAICHFYHRDFERCSIMDKHLQILAKKHPETKFLKLNAEKSPFFVKKLGIKVIPTVVLFEKNGVAFDRIIGFEGFDGEDECETSEIENRLGLAGVIKMEKSFYTKGSSGMFNAKRVTKSEQSGDDDW